MSTSIKNQQAILDKLGITELNPMQLEAQHAIHSNDEVVLLSPTGTGKTLAFLLPIIAELDETCQDIQAIIIVPSRELSIQIEHVTREMGTGFKVNAFYGGRSFNKDRQDLNHPPAILMGTPGRIGDHLRRNTFNTEKITTLVLDEFDKSLEVGFESQMKEIIALLPNIKKKILTSATHKVVIPAFIGLKKPKFIDYLADGVSKLEVKVILSPSKDKLETLSDSLMQLANQPGIVFCNFKETIQRVSDYLKRKGIAHGCFYGGMEQNDRERALIKFRNGSHQVLIATDLAARGIDVPEIKYIIHYHLPLRAQEFTHRNGRTARMHNDGTAYVLKWEKESLPDFIEEIHPKVIDIDDLPIAEIIRDFEWETLFISGGRRDKISKGDIAGLFFKQGQLEKDELGNIELMHDCAFVAVPKPKANALINC
ncbi:MAG: DEAD/DEAH box helicase [Chitinophagales bacterium]